MNITIGKKINLVCSVSDLALDPSLLIFLDFWNLVCGMRFVEISLRFYFRFL